MMHVEVEMLVLVEARDRHARLVQVLGVRPARTCGICTQKHLEWCERGDEFADARVAGIDGRQRKSIRTPSAEIALGCEHNVWQLITMRGGVRSTTALCFLRTPQHHADGASWMAWQRADERPGRHHDGDARAVVTRGFGEIPAVEMATDHDDLPRNRAPLDLSHDVPGWCLRNHSRLQQQSDSDRSDSLCESRDEVGIGQ